MNEIEELKARLAKVEALIADLRERVSPTRSPATRAVPQDLSAQFNIDPANPPSWAIPMIEVDADGSLARGIVEDNRHSVHSPGYPRSGR